MRDGSSESLEKLLVAMRPVFDKFDYQSRRMPVSLFLHLEHLDARANAPDRKREPAWDTRPHQCFLGISRTRPPKQFFWEARGVPSVKGLGAAEMYFLIGKTRPAQTTS